MSVASRLIDSVVAWVQTRPDVVGLALVGSQARGSAGAASDIDLVVVTTRTDDYRRTSTWVAEIGWPSEVGAVSGWRDADYGTVWSRHLRFGDGTELELSFAAPSWARTASVDPGTRAVVRAGCRILWDPQATLRRLVAAIDGGA